MKMKDKTVRDVALRCRWMTKKENGKRRKEDHSSRKSKDKKVCGFQSYLLLLSNFDTSKAKKDI
jgi:hypothetical protein